VTFLGVGAGDLKQKKKIEYTSGCGSFANPVPHIPLFPKNLLPLDKRFFFI
jgi:hypothetical protein